jgi:hypothetical protein
VSTPRTGTWAYLHGRFTKIDTRGSPPPSSELGCFAWDPMGGFAVLFGGQFPGSTVAQSTLSNYTWVYRGGVWTNLTSALPHAPPPAGLCGLAKDPKDGYTLVFGGETPAPNYTYRSDSWAFSATI